MRAFKFLDGRGGTVLTGFAWPRPEGGEPGPWVEADAARPCREGVHATQPGDLAYWLQDELWEIELDGEITEAHRKVVARRGRLLRLVDGWSGGGAVEFGRWCAGRARDRAVGALRASGEAALADSLAALDVASELPELRRLGKQAAVDLGDAGRAGTIAGLAGDAAELAGGGYTAFVAFVAAWSAGLEATGGADDEATYASAFTAERARQSGWIVERLALA